MSEETIVPEPGQLTAWYVCWVFWTAISAGCCFLLLLIPEPEAFWVFVGCLAAVLVTALPFVPWIPAYFRSLESRMTDEEIESKRGVFWQRKATVPYAKVTNVDISQGPLQRMFNVGTVHVQTAGAGGAPGAIAEIRLMGVGNAEELRDAIMARVRGAAPRSTTEPTPADEPEDRIMQQMLRELQAIRRLLEESGARS